MVHMQYIDWPDHGERLHYSYSVTSETTEPDILFDPISNYLIFSNVGYPSETVNSTNRLPPYFSTLKMTTLFSV